MCDQQEGLFSVQAKLSFILLAQLFLLSCAQSPSPTSLQLDSTWQSPQSLLGPCDLEILPDNKLLVSDSTLRCIFVLNENGEESARIEHSSLRHPTALAALSTREFFVADIAGNSLLRFNLEGDLLSRFGDEGKAQGLMLRPMGLALAPDSTLWMTEQGNRRVQAFGAVSGMFYGTDRADSLQTPTGIAVARDGSAYFTDAAASRVWHVSAEMEVLAQWGRKEDLPQPRGIALDRFENVYVAEAGRQRIRVYSKKGKLLLMSAMEAAPTALRFDPEGRLYVLSVNPPRAQRFVVRY